MAVKCLCFNAAVWKLAHHNCRSVRLIEMLVFQHMQAISQFWDSRWLLGYSGLLFTCWDNLFNGVTQNRVNSETQWRYLGGEGQGKKKMVVLSQCVVRMERGSTESSRDHVMAIYHTAFWQELFNKGIWLAEPCLYYIERHNRAVAGGIFEDQFIKRNTFLKKTRGNTGWLEDAALEFLHSCSCLPC